MTTIVLAFPIPQKQQPIPSRRLLHLQRSLQSSSVSFIGSNLRKVRCAVIPTPYFAENDDNNTNNNNNDPTAKTPTPTSTTTVSSSNSDDTIKDDTIPTSQPPNTITSITTTTNQSIFQRIDELAQQLKMAALQANAKAAIYTGSGTTTTGNNSNHYSWIMTKYRYYIQACIYYTLFLVYRAYRGFFIILPAVFRETFRKLQNAIDFDTSFDTNNNNNNNNEDNDMTTTENDVVPTPKPLTIRTRITISILSILVLGTYVMGGAIRVTTSFLQSIWKGSSIVQSLQYAIQIQERNELSLLQKTKSSSLQPPSTTTTSIINGSTTSTTTTSSSLPDISTTSDPNRFAP